MDFPLYTKIIFDISKLRDFCFFSIGETYMSVDDKKFSIIIRYSPEIEIPFNEKPIKLYLSSYKEEFKIRLTKIDDEYWLDE